MRSRSLLLAVVLVACSESHSASLDAASDAPSAIDAGPAAVDAGPPAVDAGASCDFVDSLDRFCDVDTDCGVGVHQVDCCGNTVAIGIHARELERFAALEPGCQTSYPACGCPSGPTTTDSGESTFDLGMLRSACVIVGPRRVCRSYVTVRPPDGR